MNSILEEVVEEKIAEVRVLGECLLDVAKEDTADDAATAPHQSDAWVVELPAVNLGSFTQEHETLSVGDDLGGVQGL